MMPAGVNDSARSDKGALKRFWDRINPAQALGQSGGVWTFITSNPAYPTAYVDGEIYTFKAVGSSVGGDQFRVNALAAKPIWKRVSGGTGYVAIIAQDISSDLYPQLVHNATLNAGSGAFVLVNPFVPITGDGAGGITVNGSVASGGAVAAPVLIASPALIVLATCAAADAIGPGYRRPLRQGLVVIILVAGVWTTRGVR
jgi:hypothetical protein